MYPSIKNIYHVQSCSNVGWFTIVKTTMYLMENVYLNRHALHTHTRHSNFFLNNQMYYSTFLTRQLLKKKNKRKRNTWILHTYNTYFRYSEESMSCWLVYLIFTYMHTVQARDTHTFLHKIKWKFNFFRERYFWYLSALSTGYRGDSERRGMYLHCMTTDKLHTRTRSYVNMVHFRCYHRITTVK